MRDRVEVVYGVDDSTTNRAIAHESIKDSLGKKQATVLHALHAGFDTAWDIYRMAPLQFAGVHSVRPRLIELEKKGLVQIVASRVYPDTGRPCAVWKLTPKGEEAWKKLSP